MRDLHKQAPGKSSRHALPRSSGLMPAQISLGVSETLPPYSQHWDSLRTEGHGSRRTREASRGVWEEGSNRVSLPGNILWG